METRSRSRSSMSSGGNGSRDGKDDSWAKLLKDYTQETTLHGMRYVTADTQYKSRRCAWLLVLLLMVIIFSVLVTTRLLHYYEYPTIVDVSVDYADQLPFPAVTICNQNKYRLSSLQKMGLYDVIIGPPGNFPNNRGSTTDERDTYHIRLPICEVDSRQNLNVVIEQTTSGACQYLCSHLLSDRCSGVLFDYDQKTCTLTSFTGDHMAGIHRPDTCLQDKKVFYRRKRALVEKSVFCDFEEVDPCLLLSNSSQPEEWNRLAGNESNPSEQDHTLATESGHYMYMLATDRRTNYTARLYTRFMQTANRCLLLFYKFSGQGQARIDVLLVQEDLDEKRLRRILYLSPTSAWVPLYVNLPGGVHQVVVEGWRGDGSPGIAIDDVSIKACEAEDACIRSVSGTEYMGTTSRSINGHTCMPWSEVFVMSGDYNASMLPEATVEDARNYCRNADGSVYGPWCITEMGTKEYCNISRCDCPSDGWFRCINERCVPKTLLCDGMDDCDDRSDETVECEISTIACTFEHPFMCGYYAPRDSVVHWIKQSKATNRHDTFVKPDVASGDYGDTAILHSPMQMFSYPIKVSFLLNMHLDRDDIATKFHVYATWQGMTFDPILSFNQPVYNTRHQFCLPPGEYSLKFVFNVGYTIKPFIALDDIEVIAESAFNSSALEQNDFLSSQDAFEYLKNFLSCDYDYDELKQSVVKDRTIKGGHSCDFSATECWDYGRFAETSDFTWKRVSDAFFMEASDGKEVGSRKGCVGHFFDTEGVIESEAYPMKLSSQRFGGGGGVRGMEFLCQASITQPEGSEITIYLAAPLLPCDTVVVEITVGDKMYGICGASDPVTFVGISPAVVILRYDGELIDYSGYRIEYRTTLVPSSDYVMAVSYRGKRVNKWLNSWLTSPRIRLSGPQCLQLDLYITDPFSIMIGLYDNILLQNNRVIWKSMLGLGAWNHVTVDVDLPLKEMYYYFVFESRHWAANYSYTAAVDNVTIRDGHCSIPVMESVHPCDFSTADQCGYIDKSRAANKWARVYRNNGEYYSMVSNFHEADQPSVAILVSPRLIIGDDTCLILTLMHNTSYLHFEVGVAEAEPIADHVKYINTLRFGNPWNNNSQALETAIQMEITMTTLVKGSNHVVFKAYGKKGYVELANIHEMSGNCSVPDSLADNNEPPTGNFNGDQGSGEELTSEHDTGVDITTSSRGIPPNNSDVGFETEFLFLEDENSSNETTAAVENFVSAAEETEFILQLMDVSLDELLLKASHRMEDMILSCMWDMEPCPARTLQHVFTDAGYCIQFNGDRLQHVRSNRPGMQHGLQLSMNIQQYEYLEGVTSEAGLKILLHFQNESESVADMGIAVPPGLHSRAAIGHIHSQYLPAPYGKCGIRELKHYTNDTAYSYARCVLDCQTDDFLKQCGCKETHMPGQFGKTFAAEMSPQLLRLSLISSKERFDRPGL